MPWSSEAPCRFTLEAARFRHSDLNALMRKCKVKDLGWRIRDVRVGPDGAVYVVTDETQGRVLRIELAG